MKPHAKIVLIGLCLLLTTLALAQGGVPDLTGMNLAQATAALNREGLQLGVQTDLQWTAESGLPENSISSQAIAPGQSAAPGTAVDVTVLRSPNVVLQYDDNDFTVINLSERILDVERLRFEVVEGTAASFDATRWSKLLRERQCLQVWSLARNGPKDIADCNYIQNWLWTTNPNEHFWTTTSGAVKFNVTENGIERGVCDAAPPGTQDNPYRCQMFIAGGDTSGEIVPFVYMAYTVDSFALINKSDDRWLPTTETRFINRNPSLQDTSAGGEATIIMSDAAIYQRTNAVANLERFAPGQCALLTTNNPESPQPPEDCHVIAQGNLDARAAFWLAQFEVGSATDGKRRVCPAATVGKLTVCILPR